MIPHCSFDLHFLIKDGPVLGIPCFHCLNGGKGPRERNQGLLLTFTICFVI